MSDAQVGLVVTAPLIIVFALLLHRVGVLRAPGMLTAVLTSAAIAAVLFLTQ
jgi:hypothetical protein